MLDKTLQWLTRLVYVYEETDDASLTCTTGEAAGLAAGSGVGRWPMSRSSTSCLIVSTSATSSFQAMAGGAAVTTGTWGIWGGDDTCALYWRLDTSGEDSIHAIKNAHNNIQGGHYLPHTKQAYVDYNTHTTNHIHNLHSSDVHMRKVGPWLLRRGWEGSMEREWVSRGCTGWGWAMCHTRIA